MLLQCGINFAQRAVNKRDPSIVAVLQRTEYARIENKNRRNFLRIGTRPRQRRVILQPKITPQPHHYTSMIHYGRLRNAVNS